MPKPSKHPIEVRSLTGLHQWEMAALLGTSREALASYESKNRFSLPGTASLYHATLLVEMLKPENQQAITRQTISEAGKEKWRKELRYVAKMSRYKAWEVERDINKCIELQEQLHQRKLLLHCADKAQAALRELSKDLPQPFISDRQAQWLEDRQSSASFSGFDDGVFIRQQMLEQKYRLLIFEAEESEKMLAELGG